MYLALSSHIKQLDNLAHKEYGIPVSKLMDNAGKSVFEAIIKDIEGEEFAIFCGKGNNGGDGLVLSKYLKNAGKNVSVYLTCGAEEFSEDVAGAYKDALDSGVELKKHTDKIPENAIVVDALLGISSLGAPRGNIKEAIENIMSSKNTVISVDIPSGISADTGSFSECCVKADYTYTLAIDKVGLNVYPGKEFAGVKKVLDIGIPRECVNELLFKNHLTDLETVKVLIPKRKADSHKGDFGKVGIIGGSSGMTGSVCLSANAALRSGAGLVYVFVADEIFNIVSTKLTEAVIVKESEIPNYFDKLDAIAVGMGYSQDSKKKHIIKQITKNFKNPVVFDAGSFGILASNIELLKNKKCSAVLTPHMGEFSKLVNMSVEDIASNRMFLTTKYAKEFNSTLLLKGASTLIGAPDGVLRINSTGNSGMATAGSGDVLSGIIAALLAQKMISFDAASVGAYIHGMAGDLAALNKGEYSLVASDIIEYLPEAFKKIFNL